MMKLPRRLNRGWIAWMAQNPVAANLVMIVLIGGGLLLALRVKQEVFPAFDLDTVVITVPYPGASPAEVEKAIILAVEEAVQGLDGVEEVRSTAGEGSGSVTVELVAGGNISKLADDIRSAVDRITSFPEDAEDPRVVISSRKREVISLVLYGDQEEYVLREIAEDFRDRLLQHKTPPPRNPIDKIYRLIAGPSADETITQVEVTGVRPYEISIEVSQDQLRQYGITLAQIAQRLRAASVELPGGSLKTRGGEILVRVRDRRDYGRQFARIPIITKTDGTPVLLEDIATIIDGFADVDQYSRFDGKPAVMLEVYRIGLQTPLQVSKTVLDELAAYRDELPEGVGIAKVRDRSDIYRQRLHLLMRNGAIGLALVFVLLAVFLEFKLAIWVAMGIPVSFFGAFLFLPTMDVSINMISLFAFIISLGIVVDDAIVVGENIYTHHQEGKPFLEAAIIGTKEVSMPVTFSILTNIVAFLPLAFVPGFMGKIFKFIPMVVCTVFIISLLECLFILPAHLGHQKDKERNGIFGLLHGFQQWFSHGFRHAVRYVYGPFIRFALKFRYITMGLGLFVFISVVGYVMSGAMGGGLFPKVESDYAQVTFVLPFGSPVERTEALQKQLVAAAEKVIKAHGGEKMARGTYSEIGGSIRGAGSGSHVARVRVYLTDPTVRPITTTQFVEQWRKEVGVVTGVERIRFESDAGGPGSGAGLSIELSHRDIDVLEKGASALGKILAAYPKVKDIDDGFSPGKPQLDFQIKPEGQALGLTSTEVARQVRNAYYGAEVARQQRQRNEIKIMVRYPRKRRRTEHSLEEFLVRTPNGTDVPLAEIATIERGRSYTSINRRSGRRTVTVSANVTPRRETAQIMAEITRQALPELMRTYPGLAYSFEGKQADRRESMSSLIVGLLVAAFAIYALLAIPFRSFIQPAIIMVSIPFGIVGAVIGHILMDFSLSILSMFGIVALSGVVVNDALVLIDFANRKRQEGMSPIDAVAAAGIGRFRPILLTTLTTFGGLAPMIFETSRQARFLIPMAISLGFGIVFATLITLILVPALYVIVEDAKSWLGGGLRLKDSALK